jgi:hypothetical protein
MSSAVPAQTPGDPAWAPAVAPTAGAAEPCNDEALCACAQAVPTQDPAVASAAGDAVART